MKRSGESRISQDGGHLNSHEGPMPKAPLENIIGLNLIQDYKQPLLVGSHINTEAKTEVLAKREGNRILVTGKLKDKQKVSTKHMRLMILPLV